MKDPTAAVLAALLASVMVSACGCSVGSYTGVPVPAPPAAKTRAELFFKQILHMAGRIHSPQTRIAA